MLYEAFCEYTGLPFSTFQPKLFWPVHINRVPILSRFDVYFVLSWLVDEWPKNLVEFCTHYGITLTTFHKADAKPPYWVHKAFTNFLNKKNYWTSIEEIHSVASYLSSNIYLISPGNIAEVLGLDRSLHLTNERRSLIKRLSFEKNQIGINAHPVFKWCKHSAH